MKKEACECCHNYFEKKNLRELKNNRGYVCISCVQNFTDEITICEGCGGYYFYEDYPDHITDGFLDLCSPQCLDERNLSVCVNCSMIDYKTEMKVVNNKSVCSKCMNSSVADKSKHTLEMQMTKNLKEYSITHPEFVKRTMSAIVRLNATVIRNCAVTIAGYPNSAMKIVLSKKETVIVTPVEVIYIIDTVPTSVYSARSGDTLDNLQILVNKYKSLEFILYIFDGRKDVNKLIEFAKKKK